MPDDEPLAVPADRNLEIDLVHTAARDGDRRWLLDELDPDDFYHLGVLWRALATAHSAGELRSHYDWDRAAPHLVWDGVPEWAIERLHDISVQAAVIANPRRAAKRLRDSRRQRELMTAAAELHNALGRGEDPTDPLMRIRQLLEHAAA